MANTSIISQPHVSELSLRNSRHSTTKYSWVYVPLSENRHIFSYIRSPWFLCPIMFFCKSEVQCHGYNTQTHPQGAESGRGEWRSFWKQHWFFPMPWPPAAGGMVLHNKKRGPVQRDQPKQREPKQREQRLDTAFPSGQPQGGLQLCSEEGQCAIFYIGPDLISVEHKSQCWSKRTPGNKAVLWQECLVFLFCCSYFFINSCFSLSRILGSQIRLNLV